MSMAPDKDDEDSDGSGCLFIIGAIIFAIAIGHIWLEAYGWLALGGLLMLCALWPSGKRS